MPERCEVVEMRNLADVVGYACSRSASKECTDCGIPIVRGSCGNLWRMPRDLLPVLLFIPSSTALEACSRRTSRAKNGLKLAEPRGFADVQGFFQSVRFISSSRISCNR